MSRSRFITASVLAIALSLVASASMANNITVSNTSLVGQNVDGGFVMVQFDLSWENSWRHPFSTGINNWDAAWVFVKYRTPVSVGGDGLWKHARLNNSGHTAGSGMTVETGLLTPGTDYDATTNPGLGVFIYRSEPGRGDINLTGVRLAWDYSAAGLAETALLEVQVFAIEMVYVPQGSFFVGTGANPVEDNSFTQANNTSGATVPFQITSTPPTIQGNNASSSSSNLGARGGMDLNGTGTTTASLASGFPTGFAAFNMMKYSITQQQYVDFLNTLTSTQASRREYTGGSSRNAISVSGGVYATTNPFVANNLISWMDGAAYMDWAGLRPMTELEFEKAARGSLNPVANEYAWGTATIAALPYTLSNAGAENEAIATNYSLTAGNAMYTSTQVIIGGPVRVGIFGTATSNRVQSGASFWGIMELSGNLWERPVTVGNATGRAFTGLHGDGALSTAGYANVAAWPGLSSGEVTGAVGSGLRGGAWTNHATFLRASDRLIAANEVTTGTNNYGFRGVRTAGCVNGASAPTIDTSVGPSSNANTWVAGNSAADNLWQSVAYGNGLFVAVARDGGTQRVMTSPDGITWTLRTTPAVDWNYVAYGGGTFVAVASESGINNYMSSTDGITWTQRIGPDLNVNSVVYANGLFVASATSGPPEVPERIVTSPDGITWTVRSGPTTGMRGVGFGNGTFVAVSDNGPVWSSTDGITWTQRTPAASNSWYSVAYGNGLFVVVGITGTGNRVMTSPDGITWTSRTSAADNEWYDVVFGNGLFVAVAQSGTGNRVMTSTDGITWKSLNAAAENEWRGVGFGNGRFVAVAQSGAGNRAMVFESLLGNVLTFRVNEPGAHAWVVPNDWSIVSGQGTNEIKVLGGESAGTIRVAAVNACGSGTETTIQIGQ